MKWESPRNMTAVLLEKVEFFDRKPHWGTSHCARPEFDWHLLHFHRERERERVTETYTGGGNFKK